MTARRISSVINGVAVRLGPWSEIVPPIGARFMTIKFSVLDQGQNLDKLFDNVI
jgi:hypothetical protein